MGELALGRNVLVAFMPWGGYNFEDSILISERVVKEDFFTSVHIEEFECVARDTKLGPEEITRDIPNVGDEALKDLDESGIIRIGAEVRAGRHPGRQDHAEGRDAALARREAAARHLRREGRRGARHLAARCRRASRAPSSTRASSRARASEGRAQSPAIEDEEVAKLRKDQQDEQSASSARATLKKVKKLLVGKKTAARLDRRHAQGAAAEGRRDHGRATSTRFPPPTGATSRSATRRSRTSCRACVEACRSRSTLIKTLFQEKIERLKGGDELPPGVIKMVKVFVAIKRKLQVGDKMAGRHGNKGVLSRILPEEDMPYLEDGTPVDIVLNPLGVPSRMNVGQILETHLGLGGARARRADRAPSSRRTADRTPIELRKTLKELYGEGARRVHRRADATTTSSKLAAQGGARHPRRVAGVRRRVGGRRSSAARKRAGLPADRPDARSSTAAPARRSRTRSRSASCT